MTGPGPGRLVVAGEVLTDLVPAGGDGLFRAAPGGSPANVAVGLARLEVPVRFLARLADDAFGRRLRGHLRANGVDLSYAVRAAEPSSLAVVTLAADGSAEYDFRVDGTADWQWTDAELEGVCDESVAGLHVGSLAMVLEPGASALSRLVATARETATVSFDPNVRPLLMGSPEEVRPRVEALVAVSDVVKASAEDIEWLHPGVSPQIVAQRWAQHGPALVAVTLGAGGVVCVGRAVGVLRRPGLAVEVADTVGAGDSFMSALLAGLHDRGLLGAAARPALGALDDATLSDVLDYAVRAAAVTCGRPGADPPTRDELR